MSLIRRTRISGIILVCLLLIIKDKGAFLADLLLLSEI